MAVISDQGLRKSCVAAIAAMVGYAAPAGALEFGTLSVRSHLNQPLDAIVVLDHLSASDRAGLEVGLARPAAFKRFGIHRSSAVDRIQVDTRYAGQGDRALVHLSTRQPIREPFIDVVLRARTGEGAALREYTAMLDPVGAGSGQTVPANRPAAAPTRSRAASIAANRSVGPYRVRAGDTLASIAATNAPSGASVAQTAWAIYRANPTAFDGGMGLLFQGARLTIPGPATIRAFDPARARQRLIASKSARGQHSAAAASGQAPPAPAKRHSDDSRSGDASFKPETGAGADEKTPAGDTPTRFGRLSSPSATPWPEAASAPGGKSPARAEAGGAVPSLPANDKSSPARTSEADVVKIAGVDTGANRAGLSASAEFATGTPATSAVTRDPPPVGVAESQGGTSLRSLLLSGSVLILGALGFRGWRERRYQPIKLEDRVDDDTAKGPTEVVSSAPAADAEKPSEFGSDHPPDDSENDATCPDTAAFEAPQDTDPRSHNDARGAAISSEPDDALVFETAPLPEAAEPRHDPGRDHDLGLSFEADAEHQAEAPRADNNEESGPRGLAMIDPGEFDLYEPLSETMSDPTHHLENDSNEGVETRPDLARLYIGMDEHTARETAS